MSNRYFSSQPIEDDCITLAGSEAQHLIRVMRAAPGERVAVFDGSGIECAAEVVSLGRDRVHLRVLRRDRPTRELRAEVVLATAVPKGERFRWLVEKATELGVSRLVPLVTAQSVVHPRELKLQRMRAAVVEASKQSGRTRLMAIDPPARFDQFVNGENCNTGGEVLRIYGEARATPVTALELRQTITRVLLAVGPEGGLTAVERDMLARAGWQAVSLAATTLRIETAAVGLAAWAAARLSPG